MKVSRLLLALAALLAVSAANAETIRIGLPTKTYWPTTIAETAVKQKLFEKEGITAELTIFRSGAETFEGLAAGAADIILDPPSLVSAGRKKGVMSKIVTNSCEAEIAHRRRWRRSSTSRPSCGRRRPARADRG